MSTELTPADRKLAANALRALAIDAVNAADSGHPGAPMGLADIAVVLFAEVMRFDPTAPGWENRDRFVLSNGHASMLLYGALHLTGYDLSLDEIRRFRQLHSKTPGHPEYGMAPGIETTTGPLGQGFANGVGMAIAARMAKARFNGRGFDPLDHHVFGIAGDGCMMEGVASEAASLAGHLGLGEIVYVYDDNKITIDGSTSLAFTEDVAKRFEAYHWHVLHCDGHDQLAVREAVEAGKAERERPTLIVARTHIGYGSPSRQGSHKVHGEPLGAEEARLAKERLGWTHPPFEIPEEARAIFRAAGERGRLARAEWSKAMASWREANAELAALWDAHWTRAVPRDVYLDALAAVKPAPAATRALSGKVLNAIAKRVPALVGGSADLAGSNKSTIDGSLAVSREDASGRNIHFGVREHAMGAAVNGMALYGAFIPFGATFLTFSDYMRPAIRLAALMKIRSLTIFTHESVYLGEDGPTHQPVEHHWALRMIPNLHVWRPADGVECAMTWAYAVGEGEPAPHAMLFTRQNVPPLSRPDGFDPKLVWKGGYVLADRPDPELVIVATGSEVAEAVGAAEKLEADGVRARVVSMPCVELFLAQDEAYRRGVLLEGKPHVSIELSRTLPWAAITGSDALHLGIDRFGDSAPWEVIREDLGMTPDAIAARIREWLGRRG